MKESDLYLPLKNYLESQRYEVKSEIANCDVVATRDADQLIIVELKLTLNLTVILQAVDRIALTPDVYIGVPDICSPLTRQRKQILKLCRMLGLGLITIDPSIEQGNVIVLLDPKEYKPRKSKPRQSRLLGEFEKRVGDPNLGGSDIRKGVMTAYRQRVLKIAVFLEKNGQEKASILAHQLNEPKARDILYNDVYGWFDRVSRGIYALSPRGQREVPEWIQMDQSSHNN